MRNRMLNILNIVKEKGACIEGFQEESDGSFELTTIYSQYDHRTWLKYEPSNDGEIIRLEITHLFGNLEISDGVSPKQLLRLLSMNIPSFQGTSAYLGVKHIEGTFFAVLSASPAYSLGSSDADIAEGLWTQLFDLITGLIFETPKPLKIFGVDAST